MLCVALLAEGVDRNRSALIEYYITAKSPSSRRAWIEISGVGTYRPSSFVALLAEGVDRNRLVMMTVPLVKCRPPRGGRG